MKKILLVALCAMLFGCEQRIDREDVLVQDFGKVQIGQNLFLKKVVVDNSDKIYFLVDSTDKVVTGTSNNYLSGKVSYNIHSIAVNPECNPFKKDD